MNWAPGMGPCRYARVYHYLSANGRGEMVKVGQIIQVRALRANDVPYRWWRSRVESLTDDRIVTVTPLGARVNGPGGGWRQRHVFRTTYWFDEMYNLAEVYFPNGDLLELYVNVASPAVLESRRLSYIDYELDVVWKQGGKPHVRDEHEFEEAIHLYGYSPELQRACWTAVDRALELVRHWSVRPGRVRSSARAGSSKRRTTEV